MAELIRATVPHAGEISRFPPVRRDLAVIVEENVPVQSLLDAMEAAKVANVMELALFDVYRGKGIEQGKKGLAFRVVITRYSKNVDGCGN